MKTIVAGSRGIADIAIVVRAMDESRFRITEVVSGTARGADALGEKVAESNGFPVKRFPADWNKHGKSAGYKRNVEMADYADALVAVWDGKSVGTRHMINIATSKGLDVFVLRTDK